MTKFDVVSDLHFDHFVGSGEAGTEFLESVFLKPTAPNLLVAGDIGNWYSEHALIYTDYFFNLVRHKYQNVICVLGNHDYYFSSFDESPTPVGLYRQRYAEYNNVRFLNLNDTRSTIKVDDVTIIGGTLWSELDPVYELEIIRRLNDFRCIHGLTAKDYRDRFTKELLELDRLLEIHKDEKCVVLTHHAPTFYTTPMYKDSPLQSAFCTDLTRMFLSRSNIKAWAFGHTHVKAELEIGGVKLVENSFGYYGQESLDYKPKLLTIE